METFSNPNFLIDQSLVQIGISDVDLAEAKPQAPIFDAVYQCAHVLAISIGCGVFHGQ